MPRGRPPTPAYDDIVKAFSLGKSTKETCRILNYSSHSSFNHLRHRHPDIKAAVEEGQRIFKERGMKYCNGPCKRELPLDMFYANRDGKGGLFSKCKNCFLAKRKTYMEEKKTTDPITVKLWSMLANASQRSITKKLPFTIDMAHLRELVVDVCPYLGIPMRWESKLTTSDNSPSLDKILPELGYVPGNVIIASYRANTIKQNANPEELELLAKNLRHVIASKPPSDPKILALAA